MKEVISKKLILVLLSLVFNLGLLSAQSYQTRTGHLHVMSTNRIMDIEADNYQVQSKLNPQTGEITFTGLTKSFEMDNGALDRAFNSKRVNLNGYPKFNFIGTIVDPSAIKFDTPGKYKIRVKGQLTVGDLIRQTSANGHVTVNADKTIRAESSFVMKIEEFNVERINDMMKMRIPSGLGVNFNSLGISRDIKIDLKLSYRKKR